MTHLLDSSAWLAHLFGEAGVEQVNQMFEDPRSTIFVSALSLPEVYGRLSALGQSSRWEQVWTTYTALFDKVLAADQAVAEEAIRLRAATSQRLPTIDALIAATAAAHRLTLVHRDPHMAAINVAQLKQLRLPDK
ncbi:MAG: PIN domain-containing protein [Anaerolineae bacterium]